MSRNVVLSVDGRNGIDLSPVRQAEQNLGLIRTAAATIHGSNGEDATNPMRGEPAGVLVVEISESLTRPEGFVVATTVQVPEGRVPQSTEILPHCNVIFRAIGGEGESGRPGNDGQSGLDGVPGVAATRVQDATPGTDGGNGGDAGSGTNGANGGNGGRIRICVNEENTHLLLGTSWDVKGGKGGLAGEHGKPGLGGKGGKGGEGIKWSDYSPFFDSKNFNKSYRPKGMGQQVAAGSTLQTAIVRLANYRANTVRDTTGLCECSGGNGHCTGCDALPVFQTRTRVPGEDGAEGRRGETPVTPLFPGTDGSFGEGSIIVRSRNGPERTYRSRYQLELVDFSVEDENEDGIFEPGEHVFIRQIRVKNTGGMPSPTKEAVLEIDPSDLLLPITGNESRTTIPPVQPGHIVTLPGSIKALLREHNMPIHGGAAYKESAVIALKATMPGLNRRLDHFDVQQVIDVQYPLEIQRIDYLESVAQGSKNAIKIQVYNKSNKEFGHGRVSPRSAEIKISIPSQTGSLLMSTGTWAPEVTQKTGQIKPGSSIELVQSSKISHQAKDHAYAELHIEFHISSPAAAPPNHRGTQQRHKTAQIYDLKIQVSAAYAYDEDARILVVTNVKTPPSQFEAIGQFIRNDLHLKMDVYNVSLYESLTQFNEGPAEDDEGPTSILSDYGGKTVIFLGNKFEHFGLKEQTIFNLCESRVIGNECFAGSTCLFLGASGDKIQRDAWLRNAVFPVSHTISEVPNEITESAIFDDRAILATSICEQKTSGTAISRGYQLESAPKWYYGGQKRTVKRHAKQTRKYLIAKLPQERFWICPVLPSGSNPGYVAIWHGLPFARKILATTECKDLLKQRGMAPRLHPFDSFNIICALPCLLRIRLLCSFDVEDSEDNPSDSEKDEASKSTSARSNDSTKYSDQTLKAVQYSLEEDVCSEIQSYLGSVPLMNNITLGSNDPCDQFSVHFPCLETIIQYMTSCDGSRPRALEVLRTALAATQPQKKRHITRDFTFPFGQRRTQLKSYLNKRIQTLLQDKGFDPSSIELFHLSVKEKHSRFNSQKRDTLKVIEGRNRKFADVTTHQYQKGRQTTQNLVPRSELCTVETWNARCQDIRKTQSKLKRSVTKAFQKRAGMSSLLVASSTLGAGPAGNNAGESG